MLEQLHTPQQIVELSNLAHLVEGLMLFIVGAMVLSEALGYLRGQRSQYIWPVLVLTTSLALFGFLFIGHFDRLALAWKVVTTDPQQRQHLMMAIVLSIGAIAEIAAIKTGRRMLRLGVPVAVAIVGVLFIVHPQHGSSEAAAKAVLIHRIAGTSLVAAGLARAWWALGRRWRNAALIVSGIAFMFGAMFFVTYKEPGTGNMESMNGSANNTNGLRQ